MAMLPLKKYRIAFCLHPSDEDFRYTRIKSDPEYAAELVERLRTVVNNSPKGSLVRRRLVLENGDRNVGIHARITGFGIEVISVLAQNETPERLIAALSDFFATQGWFVTI